MRYEDWDVLLFPTGEDPKVPIKEFKVACHVVHDAELAHTHQSFGVPTVCCFVPSLVAGTPFQVSIHSWNPPSVSQFTQSYTNFPILVKFEARLFVDGRLMASTAFDRRSGWPHVLANSFEFSKNGDLELLKFPYFRQELLQQDHWSPADDLGRIKIVISEGFPRGSDTLPIERLKNIVAFSFQHAPLDILEGSAIAWPNQSMWQRVPYTASKPVPSLTADNSDSHAHSPRRRAHQDPSSGYTMPIFQNTNPSATTLFPSVDPRPASTNADIGLSAELTGDPLTDVDTYFDWLGHMGTGGMGKGQVGNDALNAAARKDRTSNTDTSMPDYVSLGGHRSNKSDNIFGSFPIHEDDDASMGSMGTMQAPVNTPASRQSMSIGSRSGPGKTMFPSFSNSGSIPSNLAETLTTSLLNQPLPTKGPHQHAGHPPAVEVKSRKENRPQAQELIPSSVGTGPLFRLQNQGTRKVSQQQRVPTGASLPAGTVASATHSPQFLEPKKGLETDTRNSSTSVIGASLTGDSTPEDVLRAVSGNSDRGNKRIRNFIPASSKAFDEDDEPSRGSPRIRLSPFDDTSDGNAT